MRRQAILACHSKAADSAGSPCGRSADRGLRREQASSSVAHAPSPDRAATDRRAPRIPAPCVRSRGPTAIARSRTDVTGKLTRSGCHAAPSLNEIHAEFRAGVRGAIDGVPHGVHECACWNPARDERPRRAAVARAVDVGLHVVKTVAVDCGICGPRIERRRFDDADFAPRAELPRGDVAPMRALVIRDPYFAVVGAGPDLTAADRRRRDRLHDAAPRTDAEVVGDRRRIQGRRVTRIGPSEVGADGAPRRAAVSRPEHHLSPIVQRGDRSWRGRGSVHSFRNSSGYGGGIND